MTERERERNYVKVHLTAFSKFIQGILNKKKLAEMEAKQTDCTSHCIRH